MPFAIKPFDLCNRIRGVWWLVKPYRSAIWVSLGLLVVSRLAGLVLPASTKYLIDDILLEAQPDRIDYMVLAIAAATAVQAVTTLCLSRIIANTSHRVVADFRRHLVSHLLFLPVRYFDHHRSGSIAASALHDVESIRPLLASGIVELCGGVLTALLSLGLLLYISPLLTLAVLVVVFGFGITSRAILKSLHPVYYAQAQIRADLGARLTESIGGIRVIKAFCAESREAGVLARTVDQLLYNATRAVSKTSLLAAVATSSLGVLGSLTLFLGAHSILQGKLTVGELFAYVAFLALLSAPVFQLASLGNRLVEALAGLERANEILLEPKEDQRVLGPRLAAEMDLEIQFDNVSFEYELGNPVLEKISFRAKPNSVTALVGPSGAGKSTIIGLVMGFYQPAAGTIRVNSFDVATINLQSYRSQIGVVLQETFLFDGAIWDNIAFACPSASKSQIMEACRIAGVEQFVATFPEGYSTLVGERGVKLSAGQRQRVSIARTILANPRILIFDEATSNLDAESEAFIQEGLAYLVRERTTIVIAHRLSTIRLADQILVLRAGEIVERGSHESLYATEGMYFDLCRKQHHSGFGISLQDNDPYPSQAEPISRNGSMPLADTVIG